MCFREQKGSVSTHGLRGTIIFEAGNSDSSVAMRTGHCNPRALKIYQHLLGEGGLQQQRDLLGDDINRMVCKNNEGGVCRS